MSSTKVRCAFVLLVGLLFGNTLRAQSYLNSAGVASFSTILPVENGWTDLSNGRLHLAIPLGSFPQRGGRTLNVSLIYDSNIWTDASGSQQPTGVSASNGGNSWGGWRLATSGDTGHVTFSTRDTGWCSEDSTWKYGNYSQFTWVAPDGTTHWFGPIATTQFLQSVCTHSGTQVPNGAAFASDASGYYMAVTNYTSAEVWAPDGTIVHNDFIDYVPKDPNGNSYNENGPLLDTLGRTPVTTTTNGNVITYKLLGPQGGTSTYTVTLETISVSTAFGQPSVTEYSGTITVVQSIQLPDGTSYSFGYDTGHYGLITSMTLPTGSTVNYNYALFGDSEGANYEWLHQRITPDGTWTYAQNRISTCGSGVVNCQQTNTVTKPNGDTIAYTFTLNGGAWESEAQYYTGSSSLVSTVTQCWNFVTITNGTCQYSTTSGSSATNVEKLAASTTMPIPNGSVTKTAEYSYDGYGNTTKVQEWNYYTGSLPANPDRTTTIVYQQATNYVNALILNRPASITVTNASGGTVAQTLYTYDGGSLTSVTGMPQHDDTYYGTGDTTRGNVTLVQKLVSGSTYLNSSMTYDTTGQILTSTDFNNDQTRYVYSGTYYNAYPTTVTNALNQAANMGYDFNTGLLTSVVDPNSQTTSFSFDNMSRPVTTTYPDGGWTLNQYPSANETQIDTYTGLTSSTSTTSCPATYSNPPCRHGQTLLDGMGRLSNSLVVNDPDGQTTVGTQYDSNGRAASLKNPYRSTSDPTYGTTQYSYDGLDRTIKVTDQDNSAANTYFGSSVGSNGGASSQLCSGFGLGYPILFGDEASKKRQTWTDAFGRSIETDEPDSSGNLTVATCYSYDLNNNLTQVVQGSETRSYGYDLMSRLTSKTDPETGTTYLYYTNASGSLCSGDPSAVCRRVGPAANQTNPAVMVTTNYSYDALNRLTQKTYSDSTPTLAYLYDSTNCLSLPACYNVGRRTSMTDASGSTSWAYDKMGRVWKESQTISNVTKVFSFTYNFDGSLATITYPSGRTLTYVIGSVGSFTSLADNTDSVHPIPYATGAHYAPFGALSSIQNGPTNILSTWWYSNRLQPCRMAVNTTGSAPSNCADSNHGNVLDLAYGFGTPSNNGNVTRISDNRTGMSGRSVNYAYDPLNRITQAYTDATSGSYCWAETFTIDRFSNLTGIGSKSDHPSCSQESLNLTATWQNRLSTGFGSDYQYDAAGNLTRMPSPESASYTYNAENQLTQASDFFTAGYLYDGDGKRVAKTFGSTPYQLYWYGIDGAPLAVSDGSGNFTDEYIFFAGKRIARRVVSGQ